VTPQVPSSCQSELSLRFQWSSPEPPVGNRTLFSLGPRRKHVVSPHLFRGVPSVSCAAGHQPAAQGVRIADTFGSSALGITRASPEKKGMLPEPLQAASAPTGGLCALSRLQRLQEGVLTPCLLAHLGRASQRPGQGLLLLRLGHFFVSVCVSSAARRMAPIALLCCPLFTLS
jgi:hypothetical protein